MNNTGETKMHKKTKSELLTIIENLTLQLDIETDKAIIRKERIEELEEDIKGFEQELDDKIYFEDTLNIAKNIMGLIKDSRWKLSLGVESESEELEKLTEKLEETLS
jgi:hypothetical protein